MQSAGESPPVPVALALALALALAQWPMGPALASKPNASFFIAMPHSTAVFNRTKLHATQSS
jgi:hypothetical protein